MTQDERRDPRVRQFVLPTRVVWQTETGVADSAALLRSDTGQAVIAAAEFCAVRHRVEPPGLLLDFGAELNGGLQIVVARSDPNPLNVRVRFGESVGEAMGEPNNDHAGHDFMFPLRQYGTQEVGNTGFRFVRLDFLDAGCEAQVAAVRAVSLLRPLEYQGAFRCDDERLNEIWRVGANTVHLCLQDFVWDGIKRDRLVWIGDMHPEAQVVAAAFGPDPIVPQSLDFVRDGTPLPHWMNGISSYSLWWVLIQRDWYRRWGDREYLAQQREYLTGLLALLAEQVGDDGRENLGGRRFLDWPTEGNDSAKHTGLHALLLMALEAGAELSRVLGEEASAQRCSVLAARMRGYVPPVDPGSKQASALLALSGLDTPEDVNRRALAVDPLHGLSTFYGYYVLQARALAGDYDGCLEVIRRYWGAMLDLGATTFWEHFELDWTANAGRIDELTPPGKVDVHATYGDHCYQGLRHSLCHGWAAGPTAWLSEHVLGVEVLEPGCRRVRICPHLGDLREVEGVFPTAHGPLQVRHRRGRSGDVRTRIKTPRGVAVVE